MYVINPKTNIVNVWEDTTINKQRVASGSWGVELYEGPVEEFEGTLYRKGFAPKPSLAELKAAKHAEINEERDKQEQSGFEYLGRIFDSDQISCIRILGASVSAQTAIAAKTPFTITWTAQDNSTVELNAEQLLGLTVVLAQHSNMCHERGKELKGYLDAAQTPEEVAAITWDYVPPEESEPSSAESVNSILEKD